MPMAAVAVRANRAPGRHGQPALSEKTVRNHVSAILVKLQVPDRASAVAKARDAGLGTNSQQQTMDLS
jgi:Bacterial regulatory proteins, luxR family